MKKWRREDEMVIRGGIMGLGSERIWEHEK
jgi:hypothetical protein